MSKKFWLKHITLHKSPGFASGTFPPVGKLGEHLNVIWGPNAVGKSTLSRAMRALVWDTQPGDEVEAEGLLQTPDTEWGLSVAQGKLTQTRLEDNQDLRLPGRNDELSESYWFTLHELLQEDDSSTEAFLRQVRTSMQGGVDLDTASVNAGGIPSFSSGNIAQAKQLRQASEDLQQILRTQGEHQGIQDTIKALEKALQEAGELSAHKALIEDARSLVELAKKIEEQEQQLALYSPSMALIDKSSPARLEELQRAKDKAEEEKRSYTQTRDTLTQRVTDCAITAEQLQDVEKPGRIANQFAAYKDALQVHKKAELEFGSAQEELLEWEREHSWLIDGHADDKTLKSYVSTLKTLAQECEPLRCNVAANRRLLDELGEPEEIQHSAQDLSLLQIRLSDWITSFWKVQGTPNTKAVQPGRKKWLLILILGIGGAFSYLGMVFHPGLYILGVAFMLLSVVMLVPSPSKSKEYKRAEQALQQARQEAEELFKQFDREGPVSWTPEFCHKISGELSSEIASLHKTEQLNQRRKLAEGHLGLALQRLQTWTESWQKAVNAIGLKDGEANLEGSQFFHFAERLQIWSTYRLHFVTTQEALSVGQKESSRILLLLQGELETQESEITTLQAMADSLIKRFNEARSLHTRLGENESRLSASHKAFLLSESAIKEFWKSIGLAFGDETTLRDLVSNLGVWNDLRYSLKHNRSLYSQKSQDLPEALELATKHTFSDLSDALDKVVQQQKALEEKRVELGGLRATFDALASSSDLSTALLKQESATLDLEDFRSEQVMARMIASLASDLKKESEEKFQPQVLKHASTWLSDITNHRYTLSANNEGFFATDTIMAKNYNLDELSSGTRIQLLFSIRMAFITMQEETSGVNLPIFLDELLANSDDDRALAIAQAIGNIAKERQVFYVTAQRDEVEKLKTIATSEVTVISLEDLKRAFKVSNVPLQEYVYSKKEVPSALEDYQVYGRTLSVAGASLWGTIESLHSWHLLTDSAELYDYLQQGLTHIGQLISAKAQKNPALAFRLELLQAAQQRAQQGRAKKVHLSDLEDPALDVNRSAKFWEQIQDVVGSEGCTGEELLEAVEDKRIQRFGDANLDMLTSWLFENKFVSDKKSMGSQSIVEDLFVEFDALAVGSEEERVIMRWLNAVI